jgi:dynein light intermediate chain 1
VLRDGFDVDRVSKGWSIDLDQPFPRAQPNGTDAENGQVNGEDEPAVADPEGSTVTLYEEAVQDPTMDALQLAGRNTHSTQLEVETIDTQAFLAQQLKVLDAFKQKNEEASREDARNRTYRKTNEDEYLVGGSDAERTTEAKVLEHIGPVQFNMGGIQVDADDMVQRLKVSPRAFVPSSISTYPNSDSVMLILTCVSQERQAFVSPSEPESPTTADEAMEATPHMDTENLQAFFHGLMNRRGALTK